jgi:hypothetical protein
MNNFVGLSVLAIFSLLACSPLGAQQNPPPCGEMKYEDRNMIDYGPLRVSAVRGDAKDFQGLATHNARVGVFFRSGSQASRNNKSYLRRSF